MSCKRSVRPAVQGTRSFVQVFASHGAPICDWEGVVKWKQDKKKNNYATDEIALCKKLGIHEMENMENSLFIKKAFPSQLIVNHESYASAITKVITFLHSLRQTNNYTFTQINCKANYLFSSVMRIWLLRAAL